MRDVVRAFTHFQSRPVTVKVRIGADETNPRLHTVIGEYESWGASAVTIHGRSRKQRYSRLANWDYVQSCTSLTQLPVIGNGDLLCPEDYVLRKETCPGVTSFMVGRGALLKPWLFTEFKENRVWDISASERFDILKKFCGYGLSHWGADDKGVATTRRFLLEWLSFYCRYVPVALLERMPQRMNDRPPFYAGRDDLETLLASDSVTDWVRISEMLLGPVKGDFKFTPKHKGNSYTVTTTAAANDGEDQG
jgi:tRNA-dihydrouridine synthase 3